MNIDTNKYYNYRRQVLGTYVDRDGAYGSQCWDLYLTGAKRMGLRALIVHLADMLKTFG